MPFRVCILAALAIIALPIAASAGPDRTAFAGPDCSDGKEAPTVWSASVSDACRISIQVHYRYSTVITSDGPVLKAIRPAINPSNGRGDEPEGFVLGILYDPSRNGLVLRPERRGRYTVHMVLETSEGDIPVIVTSGSDRAPSDARVVIQSRQR